MLPTYTGWQGIAPTGGVTENCTERFEHAGFMVIRHDFDIALLHTAKAPPHAEQPTNREEQRGNQVAKRRRMDK